jgi:uncharacterized membrane protein YkoI
MRNVRILVFVLMCIGISGIATADILRVADGTPPVKNLLQDQKVRVSNRQAAARVKRSYPGSKIISIKLIHSGGPPVYRVRLLTDGVVNHVFVDGINGDLFE